METLESNVIVEDCEANIIVGQVDTAFHLSEILQEGIIAVAMAHSQLDRDNFLQSIKGQRHTGLKDQLWNAYINEDAHEVARLVGIAQDCALNGLYRRTVVGLRPSSKPKKLQNHSKLKARRI